MRRKRVTELFPFLVPLRTRQRQFFFYHFNLRKSRPLAGHTGEYLPFEVSSASSPMTNPDTGMPMVYQENKICNLKLLAGTLNGLLIRPGETFSLGKAIYETGRKHRFLDGLEVINGKLTTAPGGGLCQASNQLFAAFLRSPLEIAERHGHTVREFRDPTGGGLLGIDATIAAGFKDLKVKNTSGQTYQIRILFEGDEMVVKLLAGEPQVGRWEIVNENTVYIRSNGVLTEETDVVRRHLNAAGTETARQFLYRNRCRIGYEPDPRIEMIER